MFSKYELSFHVHLNSDRSWVYEQLWLIHGWLTRWDQSRRQPSASCQPTSDAAFAAPSVSLQAAPNFDVNEKLFSLLRQSSLVDYFWQSTSLVDCLNSLKVISTFPCCSIFLRSVLLVWIKKFSDLLLVCSWSWKKKKLSRIPQIKSWKIFRRNFPPRREQTLRFCRLQFHFFNVGARRSARSDFQRSDEKFSRSLREKSF